MWIPCARCGRIDQVCGASASALQPPFRAAWGQGKFRVTAPGRKPGGRPEGLTPQQKIVSFMPLRALVVRRSMRPEESGRGTHECVRYGFQMRWNDFKISRVLYCSATGLPCGHAIG